MGARRDLVAVAALAGLLALVYWRLLIDGFILLGFDAFVYFYPLMAYRDARLLGGEMPLWAPDYFLGAPFLANPQAGVLYPPNWLTIGLEPPRAYAWQAFGHSALLGAGGYVAARRMLGVGMLAGLTAGILLAAGGYGQSLVGHLNQLQAAAWLPWALLAAERSWPLLGIVLAAQYLAGHAQQSYMTVALVGTWRLVLPLLAGGLSKGFTARPLARRVAGLTGAGMVAALLSAPQLLPTLELTGLGIRADGMTYREAVAFSLPPWSMLLSLLPVFTLADQPVSEWLAYVGVAGLLLAGLGLVAGQPRTVAWLCGGIGLAAVLLAMGQFGPLYPALYRIIPGLSLFRVPARWLFTYSWALAMLAAMGMDLLSRGVTRDEASRYGRGLALLTALVAAPFLAYGWMVVEFPLRVPSGENFMRWGLAGALALALMGAAVRRASPRPAGDGQRGGHSLAGFRVAPAILVALVAVELLLASARQEVNRAGPAEAYRSLRPTEANLRTQIDATAGGPHRTLAITDSGFDPGDIELLRGQVASVMAPEQVEYWVAAAKHKDTLTPSLSLRFGIPALDGYDGGVLPLRSFVGIKELFPLRGTNIVDGRLGIQLDRMPPPALLSWLNVRWVVMDRHRDLWADGVYFDRALRVVLRPGERVDLDGIPGSGRATRVATLARLAEGSPASGGGTLVVEVRDAGGRVVTATTPIVGLTAGPRSVDLPVAVERLGSVALLSTGDQAVEVVALTLLDGASSTSWPVPLAAGIRYAALGDVKIYENTRALPRAFVVHGRVPVSGDNEARSAIAAGLDLRASAAVVDTGPAAPGGATESGEGVLIVSYAAERVELIATLARPGLLVLTDADYPGWSASVNAAPANILRANGGVRALDLPAGRHRVLFAYRPAAPWIGAGLAGVGAAICLGYVVARVVPRRGRP